jgi:hypothetical protein
MPGPTSEPGGPDEFERRIREITGDISGPTVIREPSAAERTRKAARKSGWRNARKARKLLKPVPEPARGPRPPAREPRPPAREPRPPARGRIWSLVVVVVVLACMAGAIVAIIKLARHPPKANSADNTPVTNGATPSGSPTGSGSPASSPPTPTLAAPFLGTRAQSYANGAAGIVIPPAQAVGRYSAGQVAQAYRMTRTMLIAAHLDPQTLRGGSPDAFLGLLIREQRKEIVAGLDKIGLDSRGYAKSTRTLVTSFAPGSTQLVGSVIKVHGTMQATTGRNGSFDVLQIRADYLFVYPVERPGQPATLMRIVARTVVDVDFAAYTGPGGPLEPWWLPQGGGDAGARCDVYDGFVHPQFPNGTPDKVKPTGAPVDPYDQAAPPGHQQCQATTGT